VTGNAGGWHCDKLPAGARIPAAPETLQTQPCGEPAPVSASSIGARPPALQSLHVNPFDPLRPATCRSHRLRPATAWRGCVELRPGCVQGWLVRWSTNSSQFDTAVENAVVLGAGLVVSRRPLFAARVDPRSLEDLFRALSRGQPVVAVFPDRYAVPGGELPAPSSSAARPWIKANAALAARPAARSISAGSGDPGWSLSSIA
jgi:hypothetical protein